MEDLFAAVVVLALIGWVRVVSDHVASGLLDESSPVTHPGTNLYDWSQARYLGDGSGGRDSPGIHKDEPVAVMIHPRTPVRLGLVPSPFSRLGVFRDDL
jgi:hypothetical protein